MDESKLISIVVPIYNASKTIKKCVQSICNQSYSNLEIILVNDGSNDESLDICNELALYDKRIMVISQKNSGVSVSRNRGIEIAKGDYIGFVDADDWLDIDMYRCLLSICEERKADIVFCNYTEVYRDNNSISNNQFVNIDRSYNIKESILKEIICTHDNNIMGVCWRTLIKRELLIKNNIRFDKEIKMAEDMLFVVQCIDVAKNIEYTEKTLYYYYLNDGSVTSKYIENIWDDMMKVNMWFKNNLLPKYCFLEDGVRECIANSVILAIANSCKSGTKYNFHQRILYSYNISNDELVVESIKKSWKNRKKFYKKVWPQLVCIALKLNFIVVLYHSLKNKKIFRA